MKKRISNIIYTLFFIIAILFEIYFMRNYSHDIVTMICGGIVVVIASYLFIEVLIEIYHKEQDLYFQEAKKRENEYISQTKKQIEDLIKVEKAIYVVTRKNVDSLESLRQEQQRTQELLEEILSSYKS